MTIVTFIMSIIALVWCLVLTIMLILRKGSERSEMGEEPQPSQGAPAQEEQESTES